MQHDTLGGKRLYALIGEDVRDLPAPFLQKLELLLQRQQREEPSPSPARLTLVRPDEGGYADGMREEGIERWRKDSIAFRRTLQSLSAILEILQAAHMDVPDEHGETMLAPHLVEGLLAAGRGLADTTLKTLDGTH